MAIVYTRAEMYEEACEELDVILSMPSWFSTDQMQLDPLLAPLRELPCFQELLEKYGSNEGI